MDPQEVDAELMELVEFLDHDREDVRNLASQHVEALSGSVDGSTRLALAAEKLYPSLLRRLGVDRCRAVALVNLSQDESQARKIAQGGAVERCMDLLRDEECDHRHLATMLLVNLTQLDDCAESVLLLDHERLRGVHAVFLLRSLTASFAGECEDPFEHAADILTNLTRLQGGRQVLVDSELETVVVLVNELQAGKVARRRGAAACLKNLCMEEETLAYIIAQLGDPSSSVLQHENEKGGKAASYSNWQKLLHPVSGEIPKEHDPQVRLLVAEIILCIAGQEEGLKALWSANAPESIRKGYEFEEEEEVCAVIEQVAEKFISSSNDQND